MIGFDGLTVCVVAFVCQFLVDSCPVQAGAIWLWTRDEVQYASPGSGGRRFGKGSSLTFFDALSMTFPSSSGLRTNTPSSECDREYLPMLDHKTPVQLIHTENKTPFSASTSSWTIHLQPRHRKSPQDHPFFTVVAMLALLALLSFKFIVPLFANVITGVPDSAPSGFAQWTSPIVVPSPNVTGAGDWASAVARAKSLVAQMTLQEKVNLTTGQGLNGRCVGNTGVCSLLFFPGRSLIRLCVRSQFRVLGIMDSAFRQAILLCPHLILLTLV
jgi:hypothetical protein